jgi:hypothetical protein
MSLFESLQKSKKEAKDSPLEFAGNRETYVRNIRENFGKMSFMGVFYCVHVINGPQFDAVSE